jgi:ABC-2 type transport system ATP-binding protein
MSASDSVPQPSSFDSARYVGRVGALAAALGIGSMVLLAPWAYADTDGSGGARGSGSSVSSSDGGQPSSPRQSRGNTRGTQHEDAPAQSGSGAADSIGSAEAAVLVPESAGRGGSDTAPVAVPDAQDAVPS